MSTPELIWQPSANFAERRGGILPNMIVLHYTAMTSAEAALERLCDPAAEVSAHYLIAGDGRIWQMVDEADRAWHAGAGSWAGCDDINSRSIGIELDNTGAHPFAEPQMAALEALMPGIMARWSIAPVNVIAHSDMAPERKSDPGARFDWQRLARQGLSVWHEGTPIEGRDLSRFGDFAQSFGYPKDTPHEDLLRAFRLRFRPWKSGAIDARDLEIIQSLARLHVDHNAPNA